MNVAEHKVLGLLAWEVSEYTATHAPTGALCVLGPSMMGLWRWHVMDRKYQTVGHGLTLTRELAEQATYEELALLPRREA